MATYARSPVEFVRGEGTRLWDAEGNEYLDFLSRDLGGPARALPSEAGRGGARAGGAADARGQPLLHRAGDAARQAARGLLARRQGVLLQLRRRGDRVRDQARAPAPPRRRFRRAVEGASTAARWGRCRPRRRRPSRRRSPRSFRGSRSCPRNDPDALAAAVDENTAAVLLEPVQGESGIHPLDPDLLAAAREACDAHGALLIFDEIQCGMGRTGTLWAMAAARGDARRDDGGQGSRRRAADRRLRDQRPRTRASSSPATTARPSPAARSSRPPRTPCSTWSTTRPSSPAVARARRAARRRPARPRPRAARARPDAGDPRGATRPRSRAGAARAASRGQRHRPGQRPPAAAAHRVDRGDRRGGAPDRRPTGVSARLAAPPSRQGSRARFAPPPAR